MRSLRFSAIGAVFLSASAYAGWDVSEWLRRDVLSRIDITGNRQLGFHLHDVDGDREAFNTLTYYGQGDRRFTDTGHVRVVGQQVLGALNFDIAIADSRFSDPQAQRISLNYKNGPVQVDAGDIQGSLLNTNQFASISKSVRGASVSLRQGRFAAKVLRTDTKASAKTISIPGNNSIGPYYLQSSQIVRGSELVMVDGREMQLGVDYTVNYELGSITFIKEPISPTSSIVVTYEALGFNSSPGTIQGGSLRYDMGRAGSLGFTAVEQRTGGNGALSTRQEKFQGFGAPSTPYFLQFEPLLTQPIVIRVDGVLQVQGVDYHFDPENPSIFYFHRFMPATSDIDVWYTPKPTSTADGDRRVIGFDYRLPLGNNGESFLSFSQATGSLLSDFNPMSGTARGITASYKTGPFRLRSSWRDVPDTFVGIESRGFQRNERSWDVSLDFEGNAFKYGLSHRNASVSTRTVNADSSITFHPARQVYSHAYVSNIGAGGLTWSLEHSRSAFQRQGAETRINSTSATAAKAFGKNEELRTSLGFEYQTGSGPVTSASGTTFQNLNLQTVHLDTTYRPVSHWTFGARTSLSNVRIGNESGTGRDISLSASYRPGERFGADLRYTDSASGQVASLGLFDSGFGVGYDGNGFSSGSGAGAFLGASDLRLLQLNSYWQLTDRLQLTGNMYQARSTGSITSNTETTAYGFGFDWDMGNSHYLSLAANQSNTRFLGGTVGSSDALTLDAAFQGRPAGGKWSYRLGASALISGGGSEFAQDSLFFDGSLTYHLNPQSNLALRFSNGRTRGYLPQNESFVGLFYEHQLYRNVSIITSYKIRSVSNLDFSQSGAYRSRGFDIELSFNFGY